MAPDPSTFRIVFDDNSGRPRFRQVQDYILAQIAAGVLKPGDRLPALRVWAGEIGVAYETMSKAVRELVASGVLDSRPRWGTRVTPRGRDARKRVGAIGVLSAGTFQQFMKTSRFYGALMPTVQDELMAHGERITHERWDPDTPMAEQFDHLRMVDGLLLLGNLRYSVQEILAVEALGVPVLFVGGELTDKRVHIVRTDGFADCRGAVARLVAMGHRAIAAWVDPADPRGLGYSQGLDDAGLPRRPEHVFTDSHPARTAEKIAALPERPSGLLLARHLDRVGKLALELAANGIRPGRDIHLCAYDEDLWHSLAPLGIAYSRLEQPGAEIARTAAKIILQRIEGSYGGPTHTFLGSRFVSIEATPAPA